MKRQSFVLAGAGALLAGCAAGTVPSASTAPDGQPSAQRPSSYGDSAQMVGSLLLTPYDYAPKYFAKCDGQLLSIDSHLVLFSLLGNKFGGDGKKNFALPNLTGQEPIKGLTWVIATQGFYPVRKHVHPNYYGITPLLGQLTCVAYLDKYVPPAGWAACDGQLKEIAKNVALYSLLGTKFGGDGKTTFALPDLRGHELGKGLTFLIALAGRYPPKN